MPTLEEETSRAIRTAQLQRRRWRRIGEELQQYHIPDIIRQIARAAGAASELEYRQSARRLFSMFDLLTTEILPREGQDVTEGQKATLLARAEWHRKLARESRSDDVEHAAMHARLAEQLRDYALNGAPGGPKAAEPAPEVEPIEGKKPIRRSYL
jgi:hypothetical protein